MRAVVRYPSSVALAVLVGAMLFLGSAPTRAQSKSQVAPVDQVAEFLFDGGRAEVRTQATAEALKLAGSLLSQL